MNPRRLPALMLGLLGLVAPAASGHFLFIKIGPFAEGGRAAEVTFSELAEAGDPRQVAKLARTKLWVQAEPGVFRPIVLKQGPDRLRATLPATGPIGVVGVCEYGVLARPNQTPFLLRYYPKAIAGPVDKVNALEPAGDLAPFEIGVVLSESGVELTALRDGKPQPGLTFTTVDVDLINETVKADDKGKASWSPKHPGAFTVYTNQTLPKVGKLDGVAYDEIREFATLSFSWPATSPGPDTEAVALFEKAVEDRAQWTDFPGFSADVEGSYDGRPFAGSVEVAGDGTVVLKTDDKVSKKWVEDGLRSIVTHRRAGSGVESSPVVRFADENDDHPLGRLLLFEGGRFASSYRLKDGRISTVNRHIGPLNMTISTLADDRNAEGKSLPRAYTVQYWDATTGDLARVETVRDGWARVGAFDLPAEHVVTTAAGGGLSVRGVTLSKHKLKAPAQP